MKNNWKINDIYHGNWKDREKDNHCFEGLLKVVEETDVDGFSKRLILVDMYWFTGGNKWFTEKEAEAQLNLSYYCNLDDFDLSVNVKNAPLVYEKTDYVFLHDQHACSDNCKRFYIRKGAVKSSTKMLQSLNIKAEKHIRDIQYAKSAIEWIEKDIDKIKSGDLNVHI